MQADLLCEDIIRNQLSTAAQAAFSRMVIFPSIDSTNNYLLKLTTLEQQSGYMCLAEQQTAGRGRHGRQWISPPMQNIYLSLLWETPKARNISGLSLVVGMAIINALQQLGIYQAQIKWPNDIVVNDKKLAGILLETTTADYMVMGMGINVRMSQDIEVGQPWISLAQLTETHIERNKIIAYVLNSLIIELQEFNLHGLTSLYTDWPNVDALYQQTITVQQGNQTLHGIVQGINTEGALLVEHHNKIIPIYSGEIIKNAK